MENLTIYKQQAPLRQPIEKMVETQERCKKRHPDAMILVRDGDFYVAVGEDAENCNQTIGTILNKEDGVAYSMFDCASLDTHLPKLIRAGYRIAITD